MWAARSCDSDGPTERIVDQLPDQRTGWIRTPDAGIWADALEPAWLAERFRGRAESVFSGASMVKEFEMLIETTEMSPAETCPVKGIAFVFAFLVGLVPAVFLFSLVFMVSSIRLDLFLSDLSDVSHGG